MKKKIAVFANGWNNEYLMLCMKGIQKCAQEHNLDIFLFVDYASYTDNAENNQGEINILNLPDLRDFDGVLLLGNTLTAAGTINILVERILACNIPAVCLNYDMEGVDCVLTDNTFGMRELVTHIIEEHGAKDILWLGGPADHNDSQERFHTLLQVMQEHGLVLPKENILHGDWSYYSAGRELKPWMEKHDKLPDAVVCANDNMALGACIFFEGMGILVPDQVMVTGFDYLETGQNFYPTLTSVEREVEKCCYRGISQLLDKIKGIPCEHRVHFNTKLAKRESCGCKLDASRNRKRLLAFQKAYKQGADSSAFNWHLTSLDECMVWVQRKGELHQAMKHVWEKSHSYEGNDFSLCMDDSFVDSIEGAAELRTEGYGERVRVIYSMKDGVTQPDMYMPSREIVPFYDVNTKESHIYVIVSLHIHEKCVGYFTIRDNVKLLADFYLHTLQKHLANGLERARQNIQLEMLNDKLNKLSQTDKLTGLFNREGYEKHAIPRLEECRKAGLSAAIVVVDIDRMKQINDQYGHLQGDEAIITIADSIKTELSENWYAVRYGGDEFVLLGECESKQQAELLKENILARIREKADGRLPYHLTASIGCMMVDPYTDLTIEEYFRGADQAMYMMKQQAHSEENV